MWPSKNDESQEEQKTRKRNKDDDTAEITDEATLDDFEPVADDGNPDDRRRDPLRR